MAENKDKKGISKKAKGVIAGATSIGAIGAIIAVACIVPANIGNGKNQQHSVLI